MWIARRSSSLRVNRIGVVPSGFTLIELLVGSVVSVLALTAVAAVAIGHMRTTDRTIWTIQLRRDLSKLNVLLSAEANDACIFSAGTSPTTCVPPAVSPCTGAAGTDLRMGLPMIVNGVPVTPLPVVRYYLGAGFNANQLRRNGPPIFANGRLNTAASNVDSLVLDGVTAFTPTVAADCRSVQIAITLQVPNSSNTRARTFNLNPGVTKYID